MPFSMRTLSPVLKPAFVAWVTVCMAPDLSMRMLNLWMVLPSCDTGWIDWITPVPGAAPPDLMPSEGVEEAPPESEPNRPPPPPPHPASTRAPITASTAASLFNDFMTRVLHIVGKSPQGTGRTHSLDRASGDRSDP